MSIFKKIGKKALRYIGMLLFVLIFNAAAFIYKSIQWQTFAAILVIGIVFIVLNILERKKEMLEDSKRYIEKAEKSIMENKLKTALRYYEDALFLTPETLRHSWEKRIPSGGLPNTTRP